MKLCGIKYWSLKKRSSIKEYLSHNAGGNVGIAHNAPVDIVLSDAMPLPSLDKKWESVIKGDQKSLSIAAASILAKVTRDRYMKSWMSCILCMDLVNIKDIRLRHILRH